MFRLSNSISGKALSLTGFMIIFNNMLNTILVNGEIMDKKNIIIIVLAIVIIALIAVVASSFVNFNTEKGPVVYNNTIEGLGTFNTTNVTNFTLNESSNSVQNNYVGNDTIAQVTTTSSSSAVEITISEADRVNDSAKGHTIYKTTANIGSHKGEVRYFSILKDQDNQKYVMISTGDYNLTSMMVDSFKFY